MPPHLAETVETTAPPATLAGVEATAPPSTLAGLVYSLKEAWRQGTTPDAVGALREHPELLRYRSLVVDLAFEEFVLLEEVGKAPEMERFCRQLPAFGSYVGEVIRGHQILAKHPELFEKAETEVDWLATGERFEGLIVAHELGRGTFARVYLARDPDTGNRRVALKLSPAPSGEARTLGPITHPNIVAVHWAKRVQGMHAICMPFVGETTLRGVIESASGKLTAGTPRSARTILDAIDSSTDFTAWTPLLSGGESYPDALANIAAHLADALAHLHKLGISHGDLKPSNIILGSGGHPYLIDFNLAMGRGESLLRCGGTLPYMAPERLRFLLGVRSSTGEKCSMGQAAPTDVYSLGVVLFETLTGSLPFKSAAFLPQDQPAHELLQLQLAGAPDVRTFNSEVPRTLARILARCLAIEPSDRPSAQELAEQLRRYLQRRVRRQRLLIGAAGLFVTGLLTLQMTMDRPPAPPPVNLPLPEAAGLPAKPTTPEGLFERGVALLQNGDHVLARGDFAESYRLNQDGRTLAFLAYCVARSGVPDDALALYQGAIQDHGFGEAWAHCNLSDCLIRCSSPQLDKAITEASIALGKKPHLRAAHFNRAWARYRLKVDKTTWVLANASECLADLAEVMRDPPNSAELYYKAALIVAAASADGDDERHKAVVYLQKAIEYGRKPETLAAEPVFQKHLSNRADFKDLIKLKPGVPAPAMNLHVVDPLTQLP
jgi:serine/threonine protein kinase